MLWSLAVQLVALLFDLVTLRSRPAIEKDLEILLLRHQLLYWLPRPSVALAWPCCRSSAGTRARMGTVASTIGGVVPG